MQPIWVTDATWKGDYKIALTFNDGVKKTVDMKNYRFDGVFAPLRDVETFRNFRLSDWTVEWAGGIDIAPETLYAM